MMLVRSMQNDPVVSKASELLRLGLMPSVEEIKAGKVCIMFFWETYLSHHLSFCFRIYYRSISVRSVLKRRLLRKSDILHRLDPQGSVCRQAII